MENNRALSGSEEKKAEYCDAYDMALKHIPVAYDTMFVDTDFGKTHIVHCGAKENPKLMLLHCMGFSSACWYDNLKTSSEHFDVYCIDSIGQPGKTECHITRISAAEA